VQERKEVRRKNIPFQQAIPGCQSVDRVVTFTFTSDKSAQRVSDVLPGDEMAILVNASNVELNRSMVFSSDKAVCSGAVTVSTPVIEQLMATIYEERRDRRPFLDPYQNVSSEITFRK
jgi:hypothetical protein